MKKIFILFLLLSLFLPSASFAQSDAKIDKTVDQLKDKVASKVAELNLVEKRGMIGSVSEISKNQIKITDFNGKIRIIDVDELTDYSSEDDNTFGFSDIKKGMQLSTLGLYNKDSGRLLARFIEETTLPEIHRGVITDKDNKEFTITLSTEDGISLMVDVEDITKGYEYDDGDLSTLGFTKMPTEVNAIVVGFPNKKEKNRLTASRIIVFPGVPKNPNVPIIETEAPDSPTPTE